MNRLAREKSLYLLQHASNPVDWFPWGDEAFEKARVEEKPILLSIGYSACHWCHVMERESFEDAAVAKFLNEHFVSIKVDREERPDVDAVYMSAVQAMTGSGGWPMSLFLTPELRPFFAGTYFPPLPAHGRPSFSQIIERIHDLWIVERTALVESSMQITQALQPEQGVRVASAAIDGFELREAVEKTYHYFEQAFDPSYGGFGAAPKFPRPSQFDFLFNYFAASGSTKARDMALHTLRKMALGGIHDQLGGGFHRYSVDRYWRVSHFEKMLYDQAQLIHSFLDAWQITGDDFFREVVRSSCEYVLRDMTHSDGPFYSSEDADSEGREGEFYVWTLSEVEETLGEDAEVFAKYFGITKEGNFERGKNVLSISGAFSVPPVNLLSLKASLLKAREHRVRPLRDEKVLTSWNGLMLGALARAGDSMSEPRYVRSARRAGEFIWRVLRPNGTLLHRWSDGDEDSPAEARFVAGLDDYAFLIKGYMELYEATADILWLHRAVELQGEQDVALYDAKEGGYFDSCEAPDLILRMKSEHDGAEPSGNSVAALNLFRLAVFSEDSRYRERAEQTLQYFLAQIGSHPFVMPKMMASGFWSLRSPMQIVLAGNNTAPLKKIVNSKYLPTFVTMWALESLGEFTKSLPPKDGKPTAYVCRDFVCELPVTEVGELETLLNSQQ